MRYYSDGTIDATFGTRGAAITNFPGNSFSGASAVAVQSNSDIVAAGFTAAQNCFCAQQASDFALARYTADGQLDTTFGTNGLVITSFNGDSASISALAIQSDGQNRGRGRRHASLVWIAQHWLHTRALSQRGANAVVVSSPASLYYPQGVSWATICSEPGVAKGTAQRAFYSLPKKAYQGTSGNIEVV